MTGLEDVGEDVQIDTMLAGTTRVGHQQLYGGSPQQWPKVTVILNIKPSINTTLQNPQQA